MCYCLVCIDIFHSIENLSGIEQKLRSYVPAAVVRFLEYNQESWAAELRRLSIVFANLGLDLAEANSPSGLEKLQSVVMTVQKYVYRYILIRLYTIIYT